MLFINIKESKKITDKFIKMCQEKNCYGVMLFTENPKEPLNIGLYADYLELINLFDNFFDKLYEMTGVSSVTLGAYLALLAAVREIAPENKLGLTEIDNELLEKATIKVKGTLEILLRELNAERAQKFRDSSPIIQ